MTDTILPRILLVEDNPDHAELILSCLNEYPTDADVVQLTDGEQAMDYLQRKGIYADPHDSPRPTLILLDLRMPKIDGLEILSYVKSSDHLRKIPVVILTTSAAEQDIIRAYDLHVNSYLVKPEDYDQLRELLRELETYWLDTNRSPQQVM